jgi:tetratricopeptide (TPR) repeat protein
LFSQLLDGVAHGWHEGRILKFFEKLGERGKQRLWVAWLERFGERVLASPAPNQQLAARMIRLGELAQAFPGIEQIGEVSYRIGRELFARETDHLIWEYEGGDADLMEVPIPPASEPGSISQGLEMSPAEANGLETLTLDELFTELQENPGLAADLAQQLGLETPDAHLIIETLINQFQNAQTEMGNQQPPQTEEDWFHLGLHQASLGDLEGAVASWEKALELNPNMAQAWHNRGSALGNLGKLDEAIESFNRALALNPDDYQTWNGKGSALYNANRPQEAIQCWDKVIELQPTYYQVWYNRGSALENLGRVGEAIANYSKALEIEPTFELAQSRLNALLENN